MLDDRDCVLGAKPDDEGSMELPSKEPEVGSALKSADEPVSGSVRCDPEEKTPAL